MKKATRLLMLCGVLVLSAGPVFASGPGGTDPPPPTNQSATANSGTSAGILAALLAYLGL